MGNQESEVALQLIKMQKVDHLPLYRILEPQSE